MDAFNEFDQPVGPEKSAGAIISHSFEIYKGVFLYAIAAIVLSFVISLIIQPISGLNQADLMEEIKSSNGSSPDLWAIPGFGMYAGLYGLINLLLMPLYVGVIYIANKYSFQEKIGFGDLFIGYKQNFVNILIYGILSNIILGIAFTMCFLPLIFVLPFLMLGYPILLFENATFSEALSKSFSIAKNNYGTFLGTGVLAFLISISGVFLCGIGIVFTMLFYFVVMYSLYCAYCGRPRTIMAK